MKLVCTADIQAIIVIAFFFLYCILFKKKKKKNCAWVFAPSHMWRWDHLTPETSFISHCMQSVNRTDKLQSAGIQITALITAHTHHFQRAALWTRTYAKVHTLTHNHLLLVVKMEKLTPGQCLETDGLPRWKSCSACCFGYWRAMWV